MKTETFNQGTWIDFDSYERVIAQRDELALALKSIIEVWDEYDGQYATRHMMRMADIAHVALAKLETEAK